MCYFKEMETSKTNNMFKKTGDAILPAGEYFVGDVCYFLQDSLIKDVWSKKFDSNEGCYVRDDGIGFVVTIPFDGNGLYEGSNKFLYDVETNNLGVVPVTLGDKSKFTGCGTFHKFDQPVTVTVGDDGIVTVQSGDWFLEIDTSERESIDSDDPGYDSWS